MNNHDPLKNIRIVLARASHPGNIGAAARGLKTMGLSALHLVQPREFPHPEAEVRASGAIDILHSAQVHTSLSSALHGCTLVVGTSSRHRELRHELKDIRTAAQDLLAQAAAQPVAVVFGNETTGLTSAEASLCQVWVTIPANPRYPSLNLAAAVQIFAYELRVNSIKPIVQSAAEFVPANFEQVEGLYRHFEESMVRTGFFDPRNPKRLLPRLRRLLARARLEQEEVNILRGFLNSIGKMRR